MKQRRNLKRLDVQLAYQILTKIVTLMWGEGIVGFLLGKPAAVLIIGIRIFITASVLNLIRRGPVVSCRLGGCSPLRSFFP